MSYPATGSTAPSPGRAPSHCCCARPTGVRGWLTALGAAVAAGAVAFVGMAGAGWAGTALAIEQEGLRMLLYLPAAAPAGLALWFLYRNFPRRTGTEDGETQGSKLGCVVGVFALFAFLFIAISTIGDLSNAFVRMVLLLTGYDTEISSVPFALGMMLLVTGLWLADGWRKPQARRALLAVMAACVVATTLSIPAGLWLAARFAPDPDTVANGLLRAMPGLLVMAGWAAALFWLQSKFGLNRDEGAEETEREEATPTP